MSNTAPKTSSQPPSGTDRPASSGGAFDKAKLQTRGGRDWRALSQLFEKLPPHAVEAEASLLGSIILDPQVIGDVSLAIKGADDFYKPGHGALYEAMINWYDQHGSLDIVQLHQHLLDRDLLEDVGGLEYLAKLAEAVPSAVNATYYASLIREKAMIRQLIGTAGDILHDAYTNPDTAQSILDQAESSIFAIAERYESEHVSRLSTLLDAAIKTMEESDGKPTSGILTNFLEYDNLTGGLQPGELTILAARPSMGKTALALNMAEEIAMAGHGAAIFSLEMSKEALVYRLLSARSGLDQQKLRRHGLQKNEWPRLLSACGELKDAPLFVDDRAGLTLFQLRAAARRMVAKYDVKAFFIDYLQLVTKGGRVESRQVEVSEISRGLKAMARELEVPVVVLSQLNRAAEQREGHRPRLSDLRESGSIEQDADVVALLHREEYYHVGDDLWLEENPDKVGAAELIIAKQRNGPTGNVKLTWIKSQTRFRDHQPDSGGGYGGSPAYAGAGAKSAGYAEEPPF